MCRTSFFFRGVDERMEKPKRFGEEEMNRSNAFGVRLHVLVDGRVPPLSTFAEGSERVARP